MSEKFPSTTQPRERREKETVEQFAKRIEELSGLPVRRIPDVSPEEMIGNAITATSQHGTLLFMDPIGEDPETGIEIYRKAGLVDRSSELTPADPDADGVMPEEK
jgi:hypothetical protein